MVDTIGEVLKEADRRKDHKRKQAEQKIADAYLVTIQFLLDNLIKLMVLNPTECKRTMIIREAMSVLTLEEGRMRRITHEQIEYVDILCASIIRKEPNKENVNLLRTSYNKWIEALNKNQPLWRQIEPVKLLV